MVIKIKFNILLKISCVYEQNVGKVNKIYKKLLLNL